MRSCSEGVSTVPGAIALHRMPLPTKSAATALVNPTTADLHLQWDVPYEPGVLKAIGKKDGKIVCYPSYDEFKKSGDISVQRYFGAFRKAE